MAKESIRLLIAEDDPDDYLLLCDLLQIAMPQTEFRVQHADGVAQAIAQFDQSFDLFIFDYRLGVHTGIDLLREMKQRGMQVPVIVLTGQGGEQIAVEALKAGATDYLPKSKLSETSVRLAVRSAINLHRKEKLLRRSHEALRASEERFRALVENSSDVMALLDKDGTVRYTCQSLRRALGYEPSENVGTKIFERVHPEDVASALRIFETALAEPGKLLAGELRMRHRNGSWRVMEGALCNRLHEPAIRALVVNGRDITERKRMDEALRRSECDYRTLFENASDPIMIFEPEQEIILEANQKACEVYGFSREELIGRSLRSLSRDISRGTAEIAKVLREGGNRDFETVHLRKDGTPVQILANSSMIEYRGQKAILTINRDVTRQRQAEQELRASEARYRNLVETANEGIWTIDADGRTTFVNARLTEMLGYTATELIGRSVLEFVPEDAKNELNDSLAELRLGKHRFTESWLDRKDGTRIYALISSSPIMHSTGQYAGAVAMFTDLTERKAVEQERERLLWELGERIKETTCLYTITNYVQICETVEQMLLCSAAAIPGGMQYRDEAHARIVLDNREYTDPEFQTLSLKITAELMVGGHICGLIEVGYSQQVDSPPDEDCFLKEERDLVQVIARTLGSAIEHKQAEQALRASEERYRMLFECNMAGVFRASMNCELQECNEAFRRILGYSRQEMAGTDLRALCLDARQCEQTFHSLLQQGQVLNAELQFLRKNGSPVTVLMNVGLLRENSGQPTGVEGTLLDVTETYKLREQLLQSQKMDAIGKLAGGVAHDFNNLLMIIIGYCEMLQSSRVDDRQRTQIEQILTASRRAADLTRQLLAFSRKQVMTPQILNLNSIVRDLGKMLPRLIGENIQLDLVFAPDLGETKADPTQMQQVLMNLAVNARDAMPHGGRLTIETANVDLDAKYAASHAGLKPGRFVMLAVSDTGTGIEPAVLSRIFEPFFTTKESGKGTGLGLSTVYGIVQQSGGHVYVYSEPGRGSAFKVYLPSVLQASVPSDADVLHDMDAGGHETILLVEDEEGLREAATEYLAARGYSVISARDGQEAINIAGRLKSRIDLLLTDVVMPGLISGPELARRLVELRPDMHVLYMSGYTDSTILQQGLADPARQFMQKPFSFRLLTKRVREILERPRMSISA